MVGTIHNYFVVILTLTLRDDGHDGHNLCICFGLDAVGFNVVALLLWDWMWRDYDCWVGCCRICCELRLLGFACWI